MSTQLSSTPISPKGMGPGGAFLLIMLVLGFGAFYWLSHNPNALDAFSDLKRTFDPPAAAPPTPAPTAPEQPAAPGTRAADSEMQREEKQLRKKIEGELARLDKEMRAKLDKEVAEAKGEPAAGSPDSPEIVFIAEPDCAPIGRQWLVSGHVSNSSDRAATAGKVTITLLIDGEAAEEQTVEVGPFKPRGILKYEALFRPSSSTRNHTVTARASWKERR